MLAVSFVGALDLIDMLVCDYRIIKLVFAVKVLQFAMWRQGIEVFVCYCIVVVVALSHRCFVRNHVGREILSGYLGRRDY